MFDRIEEGRWWDFGWQLVEGCTKVSPACEHCWSLAKEKRFRKEAGIVFHPERLTRPLKRKKPAAFSIWNDLFHEAVPFEWIDKVMAVIALCPQHTFQILTKRAERMREYFESGPYTKFASNIEGRIGKWFLNLRRGWTPSWCDVKWPLLNLWLGVTAENQAMADQRIPLLLKTPAAKHFVSYEPALGEVIFDFTYVKCPKCGQAYLTDCPSCLLTVCRKCGASRRDSGRTLDWLIIGCESGPNRRPMKLEWAESAVDQCKQSGVKVFVKQLEINGKVTSDINQFPESLRIRELPSNPII